MGRVLPFSQLPAETLSRGGSQLSCIVDTSILFAAVYDRDCYNTEAVELFEQMATLEVEAYSNVNIRSEFLNLQLKVIMGEALLGLLHDYGGGLHPTLLAKLRSLKTRFDNAMSDDRGFKLSDFELGEFRRLLTSFVSTPNRNGWIVFCENYLHGCIAETWRSVENDLGINFLSLRGVESPEQLLIHPTWEGMVDLMERYGLGSADAMILNLFLSVDIPWLVTADRGLAFGAQHACPREKLIFVPDSQWVAPNSINKPNPGFSWEAGSL